MNIIPSVSIGWSRRITNLLPSPMLQRCVPLLWIITVGRILRQKNMLRLVARLALLTVFVLSCNDKRKSKYPKSFIGLEISYSDGWGSSVSVLVDSNGMFFSPITSDSIKYGILPDSIFQIVN